MFRKTGVQSAKYIKKKRRKKLLQSGAVVILLLLLVWGSVELVRMDKLSLREVKVSGTSVIVDNDIKNVAESYLSGSYFFFYPKRTILFYPKQQIEQALIKNFTRIKKLELHIDDAHNLLITVEERKPFSLWCGVDYVTSEGCYYIDSDAFVFEKAPHFSADVYMKYYGELTSTASSTSSATTSNKVTVDDTNSEKVTEAEAEIIPEDENIGRQFLNPEFFNKIISFIDETKKTGIEPIGFGVKDNGKEFELYVHNRTTEAEPSSGVILFNNYQSFEKTLENLDAFIVEYKERNKGTLPAFDYIDLRYGNNIVYKFR